MRSFIRWAITNTPAMNTLMVSVMAVGVVSAVALRREVFPRFDLEIILVTVPYPGASPDEVESGICQKIEEGVRSIDGIKKVTSVAAEGSGSVVIELETDVPNVQRVLSEVEAEIDRIPSFPELAEEPEIKQLTIRNPAIYVGVLSSGNEAVDAPLKLRSVAEEVRDDLLAMPSISVAEIQDQRSFQIDVEISETTLRKYGLSLQDVARRLRQENLELPAGVIRGRSQEFLLRGKNKHLTGEEIAKLPLVTAPNGVVLTVDDLGDVRDEFVDTAFASEIDGHPGLAVTIEAGEREDLLAMTQAVRDYVVSKQLPPGYRFAVWGDSSVDVRQRLDLLKRNGLQGLVLVFLTLALFLELRLAFWVALGIPISLLGACAVLWELDQTLNMLSMFAFLIALGIVVDDAIVIGENIYAHREMGKGLLRAAVDGTAEVVPSVAASVATTIFAFVPMFFVTGVMGKFFAVLPLAVIAILLISLFEAVFILPCHLAHRGPHGTLLSRTLAWRDDQQRLLGRWLVGPVVILLAWLVAVVAAPLRLIAAPLAWLNRHFSQWLDWFIARIYTPVLQRSITYPAVSCSAAVAVLLISFGLVRSGFVPWIIFPKIDAREITASIVYPDGTPGNVTDAATRRLERAIRRVDRRLAADRQPVLELTHRLVGQVAGSDPAGPQERVIGSHTGIVRAALVDTDHRSVTSQQIVDLWRQEAGEFPGAESVTFAAVAMGPGGTPIEFKLLADPRDMDQLEEAVERCKKKLESFPGVFDIADDSRPGKWELQLNVKPNARALGIPLDAIASKVRAAYYGEEVMRLQRGRHEVKLMVRYPEKDRHSLAEFSDLWVDAGDGVKRPISELADVNVARGYSEINRVDQKRSITISADVDEGLANASQIVAELRHGFMNDLLGEFPQVNVRWEGQQEQTIESVKSLFVGLCLALLAMFVLLTLEFRSYAQPLIVMTAIPFGLVGALWGHALMGIPLTMFSVLGLVALTGVVVNDSIVLVDFINARVRDGVPIGEALVESGRRRFRPVILTSLTTMAGLFPILMERSLQAQVLIPMANSLCFGLLFSTILVLLLVPTFYSIYIRLRLLTPGALDQQLGAEEYVVGPHGGKGRPVNSRHSELSSTAP